MWTDLDQLRSYEDRLRRFRIPRLYSFTEDETERYELMIWMRRSANTYRLERALEHEHDLGGEA